MALTDVRTDLFLVDAPMIPIPNRGVVIRQLRTRIHTPLALNRGGLVLPQLFDQTEMSLAGCLETFFSHPWHFHVLQARSLCGGASSCMTPETFLYLLVSSTWNTNGQCLERTIERVSFEDMHTPSMTMMDELHDQRRDLAFLVAQCTMTVKWIPASVNEELKSLVQFLPAAKYIGYPESVLHDVLARTPYLDKLLMDTFHLLMSTVSVRESEQNKEQAQRGEMLTQLAFIYLPLSFVTGVFGMNVSEINGSPLSVWVVLVVLLITIACTGTILVGLSWRQWPGRRKVRQTLS